MRWSITYYQAVPKYLVLDNLKTAVTKHSKDELTLNSAFSDLEDFYNVIVVPPPPRKLKGKPSVENHVRFLKTHLIERLKKDIYTSLEELNRTTQKIIAAINQDEFRQKSDIRKTRMYAFKTYDKPRTRPPPGGCYALCDYRYYARDNYSGSSGQPCNRRPCNIRLAVVSCTAYHISQRHPVLKRDGSEKVGY